MNFSFEYGIHIRPKESPPKSPQLYNMAKMEEEIVSIVVCKKGDAFVHYEREVKILMNNSILVI